MIRSMTGFGTANGAVGASRVSVEIRSVNHRFFNPSIRLPGELSRWEPEVREALRKKVARGHVSLSARLEGGESSASAIDETRFATYVTQLRDLQQRYGLDGGVQISDVLRLPEVLQGSTELEDSCGGQLVAVVESAADALNEAKGQEGDRLVAYLRERLDVVEDALNRINGRAPERIVAQRDKLRAATAELLGGAGVDEQRLALEIALLAERLDVQEEISRFQSHIVAFRATLGDGKEPVGKRLGFLLQEMLRETNTTGSKANDVPILGDVVVIKEELERLREQVENLE